MNLKIVTHTAIAAFKTNIHTRDHIIHTTKVIGSPSEFLFRFSVTCEKRSVKLAEW